MLSAADRALTDRDPALLGLALILDPAALHRRLAAEIPLLAGMRFVPTYLRYKRGTSCLAGFRFEGADGPVWVNASARPAKAEGKFSKFLERPPLSTPIGPSRVIFGDQAMTISIFPDDRRLKALRRLASPEGRGTILSALGLPDGATLSLLSYRPERRLVMRVDHRERALAVVKFHRPEDFAKARANADSFASYEGLVVARSKASNDRLFAVASNWTAGTSLQGGCIGMERVGQALAALHRQDGAALDPLTVEEQRGGAYEMAAAIGAICPELKVMAAEVATRIADALRPAQMAALHGDFHLDQLLDQGDRIAIIDFDEAVRGPTAWDLGNFIAHRMVHTDYPSPPDWSEMLAEGYRSGGGTLAELDLATHTALGLLRLCTRPFRERQDNWPVAVEALLTKADALLPGSTPVPAPRRAAIDPALPHLEAALDPALAQTALTAAGLRMTVKAAKLVRHKPGKRCLIAYDLVSSEGCLTRAYGKVRAKGADNRTFALQSELWDEGLSPAGHAVACIAQPLALVPELGMWLQAAVSAKPFTPEICAPDQAAQAISSLHTARIRPLRIHRIAHELAILDARLAALAKRRADWAQRLDRLLKAAHESALYLAPVALRPVHRDFYFDNILLSGDELYLIDLDLVALGDPALDIGNFTAHLIERSMREFGHPSQWTDWQMRFAAAACRGSNGARTLNVRVYEWLSLVRLIEIADRMPERRDAAPALLSLCEDMAEAMPQMFRRMR